MFDKYIHHIGLCDVQGAPKSNPLGKILSLEFSFKRRILATYSAYFIAIFGCIQKL